MYEIIILSISLFLIAFLYASVGQGGASGYLAVLGLFTLSSEVLRPTALCLNIVVATIGSWQFYRKGFFNWKIFFPFAISSVPFSFVGGILVLPNLIYNRLVGIILLYAAYRLLTISQQDIELNETYKKEIPLSYSVFFGSCIGFISGITGAGGGVLLSPLLIFKKWANVKEAAGVSILFILVNSIAGVLGQLVHFPVLPNFLPYLITAVLFGGLGGSYFGSIFPVSMLLNRLLGLILLIASIKMIFV